ncbi:MarP family serine protease, partial [Nocardia altamirensis]|uniref:MarP family serine protease n=1 Tax=Nocardia altamirensis TaxID=472158 RepID=UPI00084002D4
AVLATVTLAQLAPGPTRLLLVVLLLVGLVAVGETAGRRLGQAARAAVRSTAGKRMDAAGGSFVHAIAAPLAVWMFAAPLAMYLPPSWAAALRDSLVVRQVDEVTPYWLASLPTVLAAPLVDAGLSVSLPPPDPRVVHSQVPVDLQPSVLRVQGPACGFVNSGSGFVVSPERVLTNAHVVAGGSNVSVSTPSGPLPATVIEFDPGLDFAVLAVPGLTAPPVTPAPQSAGPGADAIVLGYPEGGGYTAAAARVQTHSSVQVPDIYHRETSERTIYTVKSSIREGDSGGALVDTRGRILGLVFGVDRGDNGTGFAVDLRFLLGRLGQGHAAAAVDTGPCVH